MANLPCERCGGSGSGKLRSYGARTLHRCGVCKGVGWHSETVGGGGYRPAGKVDNAPDEPPLRHDPGEALFEDPKEGGSNE